MGHPQLAPSDGRAAVLPGPDVLRALGTSCGLDLTAFRAAHVARTIDRAVDRLRVADAAALVGRIGADPAVRARFRRAVAVSTSGMWRDPEQFDLLDRLLPGARDGARPVRAWSLGAADGSELCSVALLLRRRGRADGATLLGSDLLPENVALARELARERLGPDANGLVRFEHRDGTAGAPPGSWDVVVCRNVLIHQAPSARRAMLDHATGALAPGGLLLLGRSERLPRDARRGLDEAGPSAYRRFA